MAGKYADNVVMSVAFTPAVYPSVRRARRNVATTAVLLIALCFAGRLVFLTRSGSPDMEMFVFMGKLVANGGRVGIDLIDNKFPTVGLLMSVPYQLFGAHWAGYGLLSLACGLATIASLARTARQCWGDVAYWPTALAAALWVNFHFAVFTSFQLEHVQVMFSALAAGAALQLFRGRDWRDAFTLGLCSGMAALCKPSGLAVLGAAMTVLLLRHEDTWRSRFKLLIAATAGVALPAVMVIVYLIGSGSMQAMPALFAQIRSYASHSAWQADEVLVKSSHVLLVFGLPVFFRLWLERRGRIRRTWLTIDVAFCLLWLFVEFIGALLQGRMYAYHFLPMAAPAALLFGMIARRPRPAVLAMSVAPVLALSLAGAGRFLLFGGEVNTKDKTIAYLQRHAVPGATVWTDDYARLAVETDFRPGSRLPMLFLMANDDAAPLKFGRVLLDDFLARRPQFVLMRTDRAATANFFEHEMPEVKTSPTRAANFRAALAEIYLYLDAHYEPTETINDQSVWRRREVPSVEFTEAR